MRFNTIFSSFGSGLLFGPPCIYILWFLINRYYLLLVEVR